MGVEPLPEGTRIPTFELPADDGTMVSSESIRGRWVVLFFFPKAMTPGCTTEACGFGDLFGGFDALGATVVGISHDSVERQRRFREKHALPYRLLADPERRVTTALNR
jgi:peroxiredoxin Q/BCP